MDMGKRCSRYKCNNTDFCNLHYKQFISRKGLSHGVFNKDHHTIIITNTKTKLKTDLRFICDIKIMSSSQSSKCQQNQTTLHLKT